MLQLMEERDGNSCDPLPGEMEAMLDNHQAWAWVERIPVIMTGEAPPFSWSVLGSCPETMECQRQLQSNRDIPRSHEINPLTIPVLTQQLFNDLKTIQSVTVKIPSRFVSTLIVLINRIHPEKIYFTFAPEVLAC